MLDRNKWNQYGEDGLIPTCITIHNTSNFDLSAREIFDYMNTECDTSQGCHYLVDYKEVVEVLPLTWKTWHTGKGNDYAFRNSIAIEICSNLDNEKYFEGQQKAIELILQLMSEYSLTKDDIYFHVDWNPQTYCPATILNKYGNKKNFLEEFINDKNNI